MVRNSAIGKLLLLSAVFLSACSAASSILDSEPVGISPAVGSINAAAERAAAEDELESPTSTNSAEATKAPDPTSSPVPPTEQPEPTPTEGPKINPRVAVPEDLSVNWLIPWDGIRPVYQPQFAPADEAPLEDNELIIGISFGDEVKAYPITVLRFREMVNDELAGIPTLVTW